MEFAGRAFDSILEKDKQQLGSNFKKAGITTQEARAVLRLTGLLHDIGHLPFSHAMEEGLKMKKLYSTEIPTKAEPENFKVTHVLVGIEIINNSDLAKVIDEIFGSNLRGLVTLLMKKETPLELRILKRIISGELDVDRTDYLIRDSLHCGVEYGNFDYHRLLETLRVDQTGTDLAIQRGGVHTFEALLLARYFMFVQVYYHRTRRIYDYYLAQYFKEWKPEGFEDFGEILQYDDIALWQQMKEDLKSGGNPARTNLAKRILYRDHHKMIFETTDHATDIHKKNAQKIHDDLKAKFGSDIDLYLDLKATGKVHNIYTEREEEEMIDDLGVYTREGVMKWMREESYLIRTMVRSFRVIRIFANFPEKLKDEVEREVDRKKKEFGYI